MGSVQTKASWASDEDQWLEVLEKSFVYVWCDSTIGNPNSIEDDKNTIIHLTNVVNRDRQLIHTFDDTGACQEFIENANNICLITSGSMGQQLIPFVHDWKQVRCIYIFCLHKAKYEAWALNYPKIRGVFTEIQDICVDLQNETRDHHPEKFERLEFDIVHPPADSTSIKHQNLNLIALKLIQTFLLKTPLADRSKHEMIQYLLSEFSQTHQLELIADIQRTYTSQNPIWLLTRDRFLSTVLNRAFGQRDLYAIFSLQRIIKDIDDQLYRVRCNEHHSMAHIQLHFGHFLPKNDFERIKANPFGLLCIDQYISANSEFSIAKLFLDQKISKNSQNPFVRVLFRINIDQTMPPIVNYAKIGPVSEFVHSEQYLISAGGIYRIERVEKLRGKIDKWLVVLQLISKHDQQYRRISELVQQDSLTQPHLHNDMSLTLKTRLNLFKSMNKQFRLALRSRPQTFRDIMLHLNTGIILSAMGQNEMAIDEFLVVLSIANTYMNGPEQIDQQCLVPVYCNMALTYQKVQNFNAAMQCSFRALRIANEPVRSQNKDKDLLSTCYEVLGKIHIAENKTEEAKQFYDEALKMRQECLPLGHPRLTSLQREITLLENRDSY